MSHFLPVGVMLLASSRSRKLSSRSTGYLGKAKPLLRNVSLLEALQRALTQYFADLGHPVRVSVEGAD